MADPDSKVFNYMTAAADKTAVELFPAEFDKSTRGIHNALLAAGMTPALGNVADLADATLYALEGEFGDASWSAAAAIPIIGQMVAGKRALKIAKESGEKMQTLYRGIDKWYPGSMVKDGKFIGGGDFSKKGSSLYGKSEKVNPNILWTSKGKQFARGFGLEKTPQGVESITLEFEVPKSYIEKYAKTRWNNLVVGFEKGIPKEFLKKVHK